MAELLPDTLDIPILRSEQQVFDWDQARRLESLMLEIEATLKNADKRTQSAELIDTYVGVWGEHSELVGSAGFPDSAIDVFAPDQYVVDLLSSAREVSN